MGGLESQWIGDIIAELVVPVRRNVRIGGSALSVLGEEAEDERKPLAVRGIKMSSVTILARIGHVIIALCLSLLYVNH